MNEFLFTNKREMNEQNISQLDFVIINGDAYIDHPSFGGAIIGRVLEDSGFNVGMIAQPNYKDSSSITILGEPKYAFLITAGNLDSMVNHYTASKKVRSDDAYTPGNVSGKRPDRATIVYSNMVRKEYKNTKIILGGIEASLRRFAHYDYWDDCVRRSILVDSTADLLVYGMAENSIRSIAKRLSLGEDISTITDECGTCYMSKEVPEGAIIIHSFDEIKSSKNKFAKAFKVEYEEQDPIRGKTIAQLDDKHYLIQNKPSMPLTRKELDAVYELPFARKVHPMYKEHVPAINEVEFSVASNRGCFGSCSFCALTFHQGRIVQSRSRESIVKEVELLTKQDNFKGYIHDVGGPTANFRYPACKKQLKVGACKHRNCLFPTPCKHIEVYNDEYVSVLKDAAKVKGVKKVFVRSGIRYDYLLLDKDDYALTELVKNNISGQLKIAPEHIADDALKQLGKPKKEVYERFREKYARINEKLNLKQFIVPYFMSSHPGCNTACAIELAEYMHKNKIRPKQVQDFYPTPGTLSTCMFYTGINPITNEKVYVPKSYQQKKQQRALMQYFLEKNIPIVKEVLLSAGRKDLIGQSPKALVYEKSYKEDYHRGKNSKAKNNSQNGKKTRTNDSSANKPFGKKNTKPSENSSLKGSSKGTQRGYNTNTNSSKKISKTNNTKRKNGR